MTSDNPAPRMPSRRRSTVPLLWVAAGLLAFVGGVALLTRGTTTLTDVLALATTALATAIAMLGTLRLAFPQADDGAPAA